MKVLAIIHGARKIDAAHKRFLATCQEDITLNLSIEYTSRIGHASALASEAKGNVDLIIIHGGDGLINEVVNGLCANKGLNPKVFILPGGTGNDFIRNFKQSPLFETKPFELFHRQGTKIQIPFCQSERDIRFFINISDVGFGGHVVNALNYFRKTYGTNSAYILAVLRTFVSYKANTMTLKFNETHMEQPFFMIAVCHGAVFGNGMVIAPGKHPNKSYFELVILGDVTLWDYLKNLWKLKRGVRINHPKIHYYQTTFLQIRSSSQELLGEADGEALDGKVFTYGFSTETLEVLC